MKCPVYKNVELYAKGTRGSETPSASAEDSVIKVGDVVRLKSGGYKMVIGYACNSCTDNIEWMHCYFLDDTNLVEICVPLSILEKCERTEANG